VHRALTTGKSKMAADIELAVALHAVFLDIDARNVIPHPPQVWAVLCVQQGKQLPVGALGQCLQGGGSVLHGKLPFVQCDDTKQQATGTTVMDVLEAAILRRPVGMPDFLHACRGRAQHRHQHGLQWPVRLLIIPAQPAHAQNLCRSDCHGPSG
jgi:hypothetical protein